MRQFIDEYLDRHQTVLTQLADCADDIEQLSQRCVAALSRGNKLLICGNGGSAADAQHLAAELVGRFVRDRRALAAIALTTDTSALTAIANDYGYDAVFSRQVAGLAQKGDVLLGISTSGQSASVLAACEPARAPRYIATQCSGRLAGGWHAGALARR